VTQSDTRPRATGRSASFSLEEAVVSAAKQLPPLPGADREDRLKIIDLEAELGGIMGGQRLVVTVERTDS
jgi:hypothetical protein